MQEEHVGQGASGNTHGDSERWDEGINELEVEGQVDEQVDECVYETEEEDTAIYEDEETNRIMESVFGDFEDDGTLIFLLCTRIPTPFSHSCLDHCTIQMYIHTQQSCPIQTPVNMYNGVHNAQ